MSLCISVLATLCLQTAGPATAAQAGPSQQEAVLSEIKRLGAEVKFDRQDPRVVKSVWLRGPHVSDATLAHLRALTGLRFLNLSSTKVNGEGFQHLKDLPQLELLVIDAWASTQVIKHLKGLPRLRWLMISGARMADTAFDDLERLASLEVLTLNDTGATDARLACLDKMPALRELDLFEPGFTDMGLKHVASLRHLKRLVLCWSPTTDAGLANLKGLTHLRDLVLVRTQVTNKGTQELQKALPNVLIIRVPWFLGWGAPTKT
jgi:hypothetical protein